MCKAFYIVTIRPIVTICPYNLKTAISAHLSLTILYYMFLGFSPVGSNQFKSESVNSDRSGSAYCTKPGQTSIPFDHT